MNHKNKIKVLCFQNTGSGRDVEMMLPVQYFAERFLNCDFEHVLIRDIYAIYRKKPDLIFIPNTIGSTLYFRISKLAYQQNIPLFALISEGNFRTNGTFNYWGYNEDKKFYQDYVCCWSERTADFLKKEVPESADKIVITGAAGFDRYKVYDFIKKEDFLKKYNLSHYKKVIGYAGWAFGKLLHPRGREELVHGFENNAEERLRWVKEQRELVKNILKQLVENNKDTLFILKRHPQESSPELQINIVNEMSELEDHENVLYLAEEEALHNLISISDLWTCFESTTALEAWLMEKQTIFINPDPDFNRDELYKGSVMAPDFDTLQKKIDEFYNNGYISEFISSDKQRQRHRIIQNTIGYADGMNHIRTSYYFKKTVEKARERKGEIKYKFILVDFIIYASILIGRIFYNKEIFKRVYKLKKTIWIFENWELKNLISRYQRYSEYLNKFYDKHRVEEKYREEILFQSLIRRMPDS